MKIGDSLKFKKVKWVLVKRRVSFAGVEYWNYKVYHKYSIMWLNNTDCTYTIFRHRWERLKRELKKDKNFHYTQALGIL